LGNNQKQSETKGKQSETKGKQSETKEKQLETIKNTYAFAFSFPYKGQLQVYK